MSLKKYIVPVISNVGKDKNDSLIKLSDSIQTVKKQLGINFADENTDNNFKNINAENFNALEVPLLSYKTPTLINLPDFEPIKKFKFKSKSFSISNKELKQAKSEFPDSKFSIVKKDEPLCEDYTQLKGPNSDLYTIGLLNGFTKQKCVHKCTWFTFNYWHSNTYMGQIVKSRPGVMIICHNVNIFNVDSKINGNIPNSIQNSSYPFKSSVYRSKLRKLVRKIFIELYLKDKDFAETFDGLYRFSFTLYPETERDIDDLKENIKICLNKLSNYNIKNISPNTNYRIPWGEVKKILTRNRVVDSKLVIPPKRK